MKVYAEILVFGAIAVSVHAAGFVASPETGEEGGGAQGEYLVSIQGVTPQMESLIAEWTTEPELQSVDPSPPIAQPAADQPIVQPQALALQDAQHAPVQLQALTIPEITERAPDLRPVIDTTPSQPEPEASPVPKVRPKPRPDPEPEPKAVEKPKPKAKKPDVKNTAKKAKPAQAGQSQQKAAGAGKSKTAGTAGAAQVKSGSAKSAAKALDVWGAQIRRAIERRKRSVRGLKRRATVVVQVTVAANGQLLSYRVVKGSGNGKADSAALQAVKGVRAPQAVKGVAVSKHSFRIPMIFNP
nr:TonB family protein [Amylibacter sp.]